MMASLSATDTDLEWLVCVARYGYYDPDDQNLSKERAEVFLSCLQKQFSNFYLINDTKEFTDNQ